MVFISSNVHVNTYHMRMQFHRCVQTQIWPLPPAPINPLIPLTPHSSLDNVFNRQHTTYCCCGCLYCCCLEPLSLGICRSHDEEGHGTRSCDSGLDTSGDRCLTSPWMGEENWMKIKVGEEPVRAHIILHAAHVLDCTATRTVFDLHLNMH